ncbi:MAG: WD40 repeat domain-containing protein, partial [Candidatus Electrothrix sp. AR1]|nr:WD40 repeat domain-containing protein [Candidatus Electrothrix sp. AR1]
ERKSLLWDNSPRLLRVQEFLEQESFGDTEGSAKVERKQGIFRLLRHFFKNLSPSFENLERHVWLNRVETNFVRQSVEKKRNSTRRVTGIVVAVFIALATFLGLALWQKGIAENRRVEAEQERDKAEHNTRIATAHRLAVQSQATVAERPQLGTLLALQALSTTLQDEPHVPAAEEEFRRAISMIGGRGLKASSPFSDSIALTPDGTRIITANAKGIIQEWRLNENGVFTSVELYQNDERVKSIEVSPDGKWLATAGDDGQVLLWNMLHKNTKPIQLQSDERGWLMSIDPTSRWLAIVTSSEHVLVFDLFSKDPAGSIKRLTGHEIGIRDLIFGGGDGLLATGANDDTVRLWDLTSDDPSKKHKIYMAGTNNTVDEHNWMKDDCESVGFSSDRHWLACGSWEKTVIWNLHNSGETSLLELPRRGIEGAIFSPDGHRLVTGVNLGSNTLSVWDMRADDILSSEKQLKIEEGDIGVIRFSPDGKFLAAAGGARKIFLWPIYSDGISSRSIELPGHDDRIYDLKFSMKQHQLASVSRDGTVRLWALDQLKPVIE